MNIELPEDLAEEICNWLGLYEANPPCPLSEGHDACKNPNPFCCRMGTMTWLPDRIREAVHNEGRLQQVQLAPEPPKIK